MALLILLIEGRRYHAISCDIMRYHLRAQTLVWQAFCDTSSTGDRPISCDIICVLRPWFDRHSVRRSNPTEASACGGRERTCRTSSNPNFQQSLLAIIYASFSFLFQGEGSGSFLLLTVSSWQHTLHDNTHTLSPNIISPKRTCSVRWDGWDGSIERERILFITALSFVTCTSPRNYKNVSYGNVSRRPDPK